MPHSRQKIAASLLAGALLLSELASITAASSGGLITLPPPPPGNAMPNRSGLTIMIDTVWLPANGYRPVRITVTPVVRVTSDRTLQIRLTPNGGDGLTPISSVRVARTIEIPAGSSGETMTILVPQWNAWRSLQLDVLEDGKRVDELSENNVLFNDDVHGANSNLSLPAIGGFPAILLAGVSDTDANRARRTAIPQPGFPRGDFVGAPLGEFLSAGASGPASIHSIAQLPDSWLSYSGIDIAIMPFDQLIDLVKNHPAQWSAIRQMVAAGGNLCVYGVGNDWKRLAELEALVDLGPDLPAIRDAAIPSLRGWKKPTPKPEAVKNDDEPHLLTITPSPGAPSATATPPKAPPPPDPLPFALHALGRGQIVAIGAENIFADNQFPWDWLFSAIGESRWQWTSRTGVVLDPTEVEANASNFWQFLIPGVGLTPVLQFQILISLFVIAIGPVNYLLLRRWQKLNLLPITVGASAALVTLALFGYAFVHDGLGVRVRARSFIELDQRRGEAICWSRLSYYAGLSPSQGLTFSSDTAVYPLRTEMERPGTRRVLPPPRKMEWDGAPLPSQHLSSDWLPARVPTQFVTVRARQTAARLNVVSSGQNGGVSKIENRLGGRILAILLTDAAGRAFQAENVNADESAAVTEVESSEARSRIAKRIMENDLQFPAGAQGDWSQGATRLTSNSLWYGQYPARPDATPADTILERSLHHASDLPPRSFVAILESSPEVELGTPSAREEASLHVVIGRW